MRTSAVLVGVLSLAIAGPVSAAATSKTTLVPQVVGKAESAAQCALVAAGLRWRFRGDGIVRSRPVISCSSHGAVLPDPKVIAQSPGAKRRVARHSVVVLDDECLRRVRHHLPPCA